MIYSILFTILCSAALPLVEVDGQPSIANPGGSVISSPEIAPPATELGRDTILSDGGVPLRDDVDFLVMSAAEEEDGLDDLPFTSPPARAVDVRPDDLRARLQSSRAALHAPSRTTVLRC